MGIQDNDLFESLETRDELADEWERNRCYGGVFMENVVAMNKPGHTSRYLDADEPLYPCNVVKDRYKDDCYQRQSSYALEIRGNDFAEVFGLCVAVEEDFRPACYQGLGWDASVQSLKQGASDAEVARSPATCTRWAETERANSTASSGRSITSSGTATATPSPGRSATL